MENDIINGHKEYSSYQNGVKLNSKIELLELMHWIPKMQKIQLYQDLPSFTKMYTKSSFKRYHCYIQSIL